MKVLFGVPSLIDPEPSFAQRARCQALPASVEKVTTTNFDKLSVQDLDGAEAILTALLAAAIAGARARG